MVTPLLRSSDSFIRVPAQGTFIAPMVMEESTKSDPHMATAVSVVRGLTEVIRRSRATTLMGLREDLKQEVDNMKLHSGGNVSISSACELFLRFVTRTRLDGVPFE